MECARKKASHYLTIYSPASPTDVWIESTNWKSFLLYASVESFEKSGPAGSRAVNLIKKLEEKKKSFVFLLCRILPNSMHTSLFIINCNLLLDKDTLTQVTVE